MHPRNRHLERYDFNSLFLSHAPLGAHLIDNPLGDRSINFADPQAVLALNRALLIQHYGLTTWDIPTGYLCPPIPGRADYIHHLADLLKGPNGIPRGPQTRILDIGVGASAVYPIIGIAEYGWTFVGVDSDAPALASVARLTAANACLQGQLTCRQQQSKRTIFAGVTSDNERFAASMCNPPFHASMHAAREGARRKNRNLHGDSSRVPTLNFAGQAAELYCEGGEVGFVERMISESAERPNLCGWFTTLVSQRSSVPFIERALGVVEPSAMRLIEMQHGQKISRIIAWSFEHNTSAAQN